MRIHCYPFFFAVLLAITLTACGGPKTLVSATQPVQLTTAPLIDGSLTKDGKLALTLTRADITLWSTTTEQPQFSYQFNPQDEGQLRAVISDDHQFIATAGKRTVSLFDPKSDQASLVWSVYGTVENANISALTINRFGDIVVVGLTDGSISVTDIKSKTRLLYQPHLSEVLFLRFNKLENKLISAGVDGRVVVLSLDTGVIEQERQFPARITALNVATNNGKLFVSDALGNDVITMLDDIQSGTALDYVERSRHFRRGLFIGNDKLFTSNSKYQVSVWSVSSGDELANGQIEGYTASASVNDLALRGDTVVTLSNEAVLQTWSVN